MSLEENLNAWITQQVANGVYLEANLVGVENSFNSGIVEAYILNPDTGTVRKTHFYIMYSGLNRMTTDTSDQSFVGYEIENYS